LSLQDGCLEFVEILLLVAASEDFKHESDQRHLSCLGDEHNKEAEQLGNKTPLTREIYSPRLPCQNHRKKEKVENEKNVAEVPLNDHEGFDVHIVQQVIKV
jgi:hypothetical protein